MITITQFTLPQLKAAHQILTTAAKAPAKAPVAEAAPAADAAAPATQSESAAATPAESAPAQDKPADAAPAGPSPEVIAELVEKLPLAETKVAYMLGALKVAGGRIGKVRQVRVVQVEGAPAGAVKLDDAAYILDMMPEGGNRGPAKPGRDGDRRGGKGGPKGRGNERGKPGDKRGGPGARGPGAGGDRPQAGRGPGRPGGTPTKRG